MNQKRGWPAFRFSLKGMLLVVVCASLLLSLLQEKENAATLRQEMARTETATYNFQLREEIITAAQQNLTIEKLLESVGEPPFWSAELLLSRWNLILPTYGVMNSIIH